MNEDDDGSIVQLYPNQRETFVAKVFSAILGEETDAIDF
jgi:hypothetical protein